MQQTPLQLYVSVREMHLLSAKLCCAGVDWKAVADYVDISKDLEIFLPQSDAVG